MYDLHYWPTPNGWKVTILLEELAQTYNVIPVNIGAGDQFKPEFLAISPNNRMPALVDQQPADGAGPLSVFESGAILIYLADKHGRFLPTDVRPRTSVLQWLMWQMGGWGPMLGQNHHFRNYAPEKIEYAINRYLSETKRLYGVLDKRLGQSEWVAGPDYSIADMAIGPWALPQHQGVELADYPHVARWLEALRARPAVKRGMDVLKEIRERSREQQQMTEEQRRNLFGAAQQERR